MTLTQKSITCVLFVCAALLIGRVAPGMVVASQDDELTVGELGGPEQQEMYIAELKHELDTLYKEQSILGITEDMLRAQLQSLSDQVTENGDWSQDLLDRVYEAKKHLGTILLRKQENQAHFNGAYRFYLLAGGEKLPLFTKEVVIEEEKTLEDGQILIWPVMPEKGISAYFMDPRYRRKFGFNHYALDIPTPQWTTVRAPIAGVVKEINNSGFGYSTLVIEHNGFETLYGHIAEFLVAEGDTVKQGDPIALSGGRPGTLGAGRVTTGPHLHFEVIVNGVHKNPLSYLPPFHWEGRHVVVKTQES